MLEILMKVYAVILGIVLVLNAGAWLRFDGKLWFLIYEFVSMGYYIFLIFAFYNDTMYQFLPLWALLPVIPFLACDVWFTTRSDIKQFCPGIPDEELPPGTVDTAMALSVALNAPAYILACVFLFDKIVKTIK